MLVLAGSAIAGTSSTGIAPLQPHVGTAAAFDKSQPLRDMPLLAPGMTRQGWETSMPTDRSLVGQVANPAHQRDEALQKAASPNAMPSPLFTFEGPRNEDNFDIFGGPRQPAGPGRRCRARNHYVALGRSRPSPIYTKTGTLLLRAGGHRRRSGQDFRCPGLHRSLR